MSGMGGGGGGGVPGFLQNSNLPSFNGPAASVAGGYNAMPGINASLFGGGGPSQTPGGGPTPGPGGPMPNVRMQPPGGPMPPTTMGPRPGQLPSPQMQPPGGPMPPQTMGGPQPNAGGFNPAMLQALLAHMGGGGGMGAMSGMFGGGGGYGGPSPNILASAMGGARGGMMPPQQGGFQRGLPFQNPGLLTR